MACACGLVTKVLFGVVAFTLPGGLVATLPSNQGTLVSVGWYTRPPSRVTFAKCLKRGSQDVVKQVRPREK